MTRINVVNPKELTAKMLVSEYRELPRIFGLVRRAVKRGEHPTDRRNPDRYVLGTGHCRFFYPRLGWLRARFALLVSEMQQRGYHTSFEQVDASGIPDDWFGDFVPDAASVELNRRRIEERILKREKMQ